jgi:hypothetical protein
MTSQYVAIMKIIKIKMLYKNALGEWCITKIQILITLYVKIILFCFQNSSFDGSSVRLKAIWAWVFLLVHKFEKSWTFYKYIMHAWLLSLLICIGVRLVGTGSQSRGTIEILHNGQWGTLCDDNFDRRDGEVICRMLGYNSVRYSSSNILKLVN